MTSATEGARYVLAVDVGGTFTDVIRHDTETGAVEVAKTASTPPDFIDGMLAGIDAVDAKPADIKLIKIGTTIATNTVIMRTGARTALVTTAGFTDVLHAARAARPTLYDSDWDPAPALVDRRDTMTVAQRTTYEGEVLEPLDEAGLRETAARLRERGIEAVAVSFLHSYINDAHERRAQEILADEMPGGYVCRSSDILPEIREFERTSTTVANAYLGPVLERYLAALLARLEGLGYDGFGAHHPFRRRRHVHRGGAAHPGAHLPVGAGGGRDGGRRHRAACREARRDRPRRGRDQRRRLALAPGPPADPARVEHRVQHRHQLPLGGCHGHRRRRRLHRPDRRGRGAEGGAGQRRRASGACLLWPGRHPAHRDRREPRARPARRRDQTRGPGRAAPGACRAGHRPDRGAPGLFAGGSRGRHPARHARQHGGRDPPHLGEARATIRATSRWSPSAAPDPSMPWSSPASSASPR